jgi:hypothetical protein
VKGKKDEGRRKGKTAKSEEGKDELKKRYNTRQVEQTRVYYSTHRCHIENTNARWVPRPGQDNLASISLTHILLHLFSLFLFPIFLFVACLLTPQGNPKQIQQLQLLPTLEAFTSHYHIYLSPIFLTCNNTKCNYIWGEGFWLLSLRCMTTAN